MSQQSFFFEEPKTSEDLQKLQHILDHTRSEAKRQAVCDALKRIACPHNCFVIEEKTYCLITITTKPFLQKMGTSHSCEQEEANKAGYLRLNEIANAFATAVHMQNEEN